MNESQRSTEYIFQGMMYFFRREKILCRYQFALQDAVEPALLQRALEAALSAAPYYRVQLVQEKRSFFLIMLSVAAGDGYFSIMASMS